MRRRILLAGIGVGLAAATLPSCGEVPTLSEGVAYITGVVSPAIAVAVGDTLRDTNGVVAPLRVYAVGRDNDTLTNVAIRFLITSLDTGVTIDNQGILAVSDSSVRDVRIVGQAVGTLQTPEYTLHVVPQPDQLERKAVNDSIKVNDTLQALVSVPLEVTVSGVRAAARTGVQYIIVRYEITRVVLRADSLGVTDTSFVLVDGSNRFNIRSPRVAIDTTDSGGLASRRVRVSSQAFDSLFVTVTARDLRGDTLSGAPATFSLVQ